MLSQFIFVVNIEYKSEDELGSLIKAVKCF